MAFFSGSDEPSRYQRPPQSNSQQIRQEWQQDVQLREELWKGQRQSQDPSNSRYGMNAPANSVGTGNGNRRPSPYREEMGNKGSSGLAPPVGLDTAFDDRVRAMQERRNNLRLEIWRKLGGTGEPALLGMVPAFDKSFDEVWGKIKLKEAEEEAQRARTNSLNSDQNSLRSNPSGTPFDSDVAAEMAKIESELMAELRSQPSSTSQASYHNANTYPTPTQYQNSSPVQPQLHMHHQQTRNQSPLQYSAPSSHYQTNNISQQAQYPTNNSNTQPPFHPHTQQYQSNAPPRYGNNSAQPYQSNVQSQYGSSFGPPQNNVSVNYPTSQRHHHHQSQPPFRSNNTRFQEASQPLSARQLNSQNDQQYAPLKHVPSVSSPFQNNQQQQQPPQTTRGRGQYSARGASSISFG